MTVQLSEKQQAIYNKVLAAWEQRVGVGNIDSQTLASMIKIADTNGDGLKRVTVFGKGTFLVPIEDIILDGLKAVNIEKYPKAGD